MRSNYLIIQRAIEEEVIQCKQITSKTPSAMFSYDSATHE